MEEPDGTTFSRRSWWIILALFACALIFVGSTFYFSVIKQQEYKARARETAWRQGRIPALRGAIYAADGTLLAYSKLEFFLFWKTERVKNTVEQYFGRIMQNGGKISGKELASLEPVFRKYPSEIWIENRERRTHLADVAHMEEKFDSVLKGQDGIFVVMHDRYGRRVPGSLKIIREQIPGKPVVLSREDEK